MATKTSMNLYRIRRPHCAPSVVLVMAGTKAKALELVAKTFGDVSDATATLLLADRPRILVAGVDAAIATPKAKQKTLTPLKAKARVM